MTTAGTPTIGRRPYTIKTSKPERAVRLRTAPRAARWTFRGGDMSEEEIKEGWGLPALSRKRHYFVDGRSLCGDWVFTGPVESGNNDSPDNCAGCKRRFKGQVATGLNCEGMGAKEKADVRRI
jgi:hypothetical protein